MKFLIDTNIFIPLEPSGLDGLHEHVDDAMQFARLAGEANYQLYVHRAQPKDLLRDTNEARRQTHLVQLNRYPVLPGRARISPEVQELFPKLIPNSNDWVDAHLLSALVHDSVDFLVSEDQGIARKAKALHLSDRVLTLSDAIANIQVFIDVAPSPPPAVNTLRASDLRSDDPIFPSLRILYPDFDDWLSKCKREHRFAFSVEASETDRPFYAAVSIIKHEKTDKRGLPGKVLKICLFKVSSHFSGLRFGELMLKAIFDHALKNKYNSLLIETFETNDNLIYFIEEFGFQVLTERGKQGEICLGKSVNHISLKPNNPDNLNALDFHIKYGPTAMLLSEVSAYLVPIRPVYHRLLFPEVEDQQELMTGRFPFSNSIRKAYLCHANIRSISPGDILLFYLSGRRQEITCDGIVEEVLVSDNAEEIIRFVMKRTVYSEADIRRQCRKKVLAIQFRFAAILKEPISLLDLVTNCGITKAPQQIRSIKGASQQWLYQKMVEKSRFLP
jgi:hypothetical protein